jgi:hypothetical protein
MAPSIGGGGWYLAAVEAAGLGGVDVEGEETGEEETERRDVKIKPRKNR